MACALIAQLYGFLDESFATLRGKSSVYERSAFQ